MVPIVFFSEILLAVPLKSQQEFLEISFRNSFGFFVFLAVEPAICSGVSDPFFPVILSSIAPGIIENYFDFFQDFAL